MVNKCAVPKCTSGYASNEKKDTAKLHFLLKNAKLNKQWTCFVNRRKNSVVWGLNFEEKYLPICTQRLTYKNF